MGENYRRRTVFTLFVLLMSFPSIAFLMELTPGCGNAVCDLDENCQNCSQDCGTCPPLSISVSSLEAETEISPGEVSIIVPLINTGEGGRIQIPEEAKVSIVNFSLGVSQNIRNVKIDAKTTTAEKIPAALVTPWGTLIYQYLDIKTDNITSGDIKSLMIDFKVEKSWINENKINKSFIKLYRYTAKTWESLPTIKTDEDEANIYYRASSSGFSIFAISYIREANITKKLVQGKGIGRIFKEPMTLIYTGGIILAIIIILSVHYFLKRRRKISSRLE